MLGEVLNAEEKATRRAIRPQNWTPDAGPVNGKDTQ
jgi:hypothetical protein